MLLISSFQIFFYEFLIHLVNLPEKVGYSVIHDNNSLHYDCPTSRINL